MTACPPTGKFATIHTIGCRLNQADTALIASRLLNAGWQVAEFVAGHQIQLVVINSCTVTAAAAQKSRQAVNRFRTLYPDACIVATGCSVEVDRDEWSQISSADVVIDNSQKRDIATIVENFLIDKKFIDEPRIVSNLNESKLFNEISHAEFSGKARAVLKVQEGCNNFCSYCIVPYARGRERSRAWDEVLQEFKHLLKDGFQEIVFAGVNVCAYNDNGRKLPDLLQKITSLDGNFRIRLSSTEPHPGNMELLQTIAGNPKICRFLHLSLQHGTDDILRAMNRNYSLAEYAEFTCVARKLIPDLHLGTDIIVGFPGETEALFERQLQFITEQNFANIHIFSFSPRKGTPAADLPGRVDGRIVKVRYNKLSEVATVSARKFISGHIGKEMNVIFEKIDKKGVAHGWSDNYIAVECAENTLPLRQIISVRAIGTSMDKLIAKSL